MPIDLLFLIMMLTALVKGYRNGLVVALFSIVGWILGLYAAVKFSGVAADYLGQYVALSPKWLSILGFVAVFVLVTLIVGLGARIVEKTVELALMGWLNRLGGIFFYVLLYALIFSVMIYFAGKAGLVSSETLSSSKAYSTLEPVIIKVKRLF